MIKVFLIKNITMKIKLHKYIYNTQIIKRFFTKSGYVHFTGTNNKLIFISKVIE